MSEAPETIFLDEWHDFGVPDDSYGKVWGTDDGSGCIAYRRADLCRLPPELAEQLRRYIQPEDLIVGENMMRSLLHDILAWHESQERPQQ